MNDGEHIEQDKNAGNINDFLGEDDVELNDFVKGIEGKQVNISGNQSPEKEEGKSLEIGQAKDNSHASSSHTNELDKAVVLEHGNDESPHAPANVNFVEMIENQEQTSHIEQKNDLNQHAFHNPLQQKNLKYLYSLVL